MSAVASKRMTGVKQVACIHCDGINEVSSRAMSIFCKHCRKRLILENFKVTSFHAVREFYTCGDVVVEKHGRVNAAIRAATLTIRGSVQGRVDIRGPVRIGKTGAFKGEISAPSLRIESGAVVEALVRIGA